MPLCSRPCKIKSSSSWPMPPSIFPCIRQSRRRDHPLWRTRRMSETEQPRGLCWRTRNSTYLPIGHRHEMLILWCRCSHEDAAWSKMIQDYNTLQSQVLSGLQKASSSPSKGKGKLKLDLNDKWREAERELDEFSDANENGAEREKRLNERCRKLPLQVRRFSASLNGVTHCPSSISARQLERNPLEIQSVHAPSKAAHRRDVCCSGPTKSFRTGSYLVFVHRHYDLTSKFVEGPREGRREEEPTTGSGRGSDDR